MSAEVLVARQVTVEHGGMKVLDVAELTIRAGETLSVVGPNGAGKSTLLRVLGLLERPTGGEIWFGGKRVPSQPAPLLALRRRMAVVFQAPLLCRASVFRNVALGLEFRGVPRPETRRRVEAWLERFGISHLRNRAAHTISGGEAQRTSLARAFVLQPEVLLLDEPFSALDPPARQALIGELSQLLAETHTTTVFVTHDREEAFALGDRIAIVLGGRLAQVGQPAEISERPVNESVARFVGVETLLAGRVDATADGVSRVDLGAIRISATSSCPVGESVLACLRSEDVVLVATGREAAEGEGNRLTGVVRGLAPWGTQVRVSVDCGVPIVALVTKLAARELALGQPVTVFFPPSVVHLVSR